MLLIRLAIIVIGITLPYLVRIPGGAKWLHQYTNTDLGGFLFFGAFNAIAWGAILFITFLYKNKWSALTPMLFGFVPLGLIHGTYDLSSDAQAPIGLVFIPIYALLPIVVGGIIGYFIDRYLRK